MFDREALYRTYSNYLKNKYGEKVYKIPINLPVTCPNRDGVLSEGGCIYCGVEGVGYENLPNSMNVAQQYEKNSEYIKKRYKANKFIPYFQNYTNTYMPFEIFMESIKDACRENVVSIAISTRPDCVSQKHIEFLREVQQSYNIDICIELGLQSANYHTLKKINRGHTLAEYIESANMIKNAGFELCTHLILNLPWDDMTDVIESAKIISVLKSDFIKLHALYIEKGTVLGEMYNKGEIKLISKEEYVQRVVAFLSFIDPSIVIQRLIGRAPEENTLFMNWGTSWWKIRDEIEDKMIEDQVRQGILFNYSGGSAVKHFL